MRFIALVFLLCLATSAGAAGNDGIWIGTFNAPRMWRVVSLQWIANEDAPRLQVGDASRRLDVPVSRYTASGDSLHFVAEMAGTRVMLEGRRDGETIAGTLDVQLGDDVLTRGAWSVRRYRDSAWSADDILRRVRASVELAAAASRTGYTMVQARSPGADPAWAAFAAPEGRFSASEHGEPAIGGDADRIWVVRSPFGLFPSDQRLSEKLLLAAMVRSGAWLLPDAPLTFEALTTGGPGSSQVVLALRRREGIVPARVFIDPATWLPAGAEVDWDAGPYSLEFSDYRPGACGRFPSRCRISYRGRDTDWTTTDVKIGGEIAVAKPSGNTSYDRSAAPYLTGAPGEPDSHLFVRPLVDGRDLGWFHVDSGAPFVLLDTTVADSLGLAVLQQAGPRSFRKIAELQVGQLVLRDVVVMVTDLSSFSSPDGAQRVGVIGGTVFENAVVEFDYAGRRLGVFAPGAFAETPADDDARWQPLWIEGGPVARLHLDTGDARFILDTGKSGTASFTSQAALAYGLLAGPDLGLAENMTVEGASVERVTRIPFLELGGLRLDQPEVRLKFPGTPNDDISGVAGAVGRGFFGGKRVIFDYAQGRVALLDKR